MATAAPEWSEDIIPVDTAGSLAGLFRERLRRSPDAPAYRQYDKTADRWREYTWRETGLQVARWRAALAAETLKPGARVAVLLRNSVDWVVFDLAAHDLGLVVVPLYTEDRPDNAAYILKDAECGLLLVQSAAHWQRLAPVVGALPGLDRVLLLEGEITDALTADSRVRQVHDWLPATAELPPARGGDPHKLASIVYTSGTTGRPKGVMLSHHNMLSVAHAGLTMVDCYQQDVFLSFLPLSHTLERSIGYYVPIMAGACVAFSRSIAQLADDLQTVRPTVLIAVPRIFERVYCRIDQQMDKASLLRRGLFRLAVAVGWRRFEHSQGRAGWTPQLLLWPLLEKLVAAKVLARLGGRLRIAVSGGAAIPAPVARLFIGLGVPLLQGYGLTETSPVLAVNTLKDNDPASVGLALRGVELRIGENDELLARGPGVMLGYWNNHAATAQIIDADGWLHTGDQARIDNGHVYITGRIKDILVLSNGEKVPPADMEAALCLDPLIDQALVIGEGRPYLAALLVLNPEHWFGLAKGLGLDPYDPASLEDARLRDKVARQLRQCLREFPGYAKIRRVVLTLEPWTVDNGLLTPTLKVKRAAVLSGFDEQVQRLYRC